jgi:Aspartyl protease
MRFDGIWRICDDGVVRPILRGTAKAADGTWVPVPFLVDTGADRTVFCQDILSALGVQPTGVSSGIEGVGGKVETVTISTPIQLKRENGADVVFDGQWAAATDPAALDMSVLGRDLTNLFAVIVDRPRDVVCLLGGNHQYVIAEK